MHDVLSNRPRCAVLHYLQESDGSVEVRELTDQVLAWCGDGQIDATDDEVRAWLLNHVLAMDEFGLVTYDSKQDTVELPADVSVAITRPVGRIASDE